MKKALLFFFFTITVIALQAQSEIIHESFGDGWVIPMNANEAVDIDNDGSVDFYINGFQDELGFVPIFAVGCFSSPSELAYTSFSSRELQIHETGELVQLNELNLFDYIDDDRGSAYSLTGGLADGWVDGQDVYIGFAVIIVNTPGHVRNGWLRTSVNTTTNELTIHEWAYSEVQENYDGGILVGDTGEVTSVKSLDNIQDISISPNPATENVQVVFDYTGNENLSVVIQNSIGQVVYRDNSGSNILNVATDNWTNGIYFVRFETETGIHTERLSVAK